jgi:pimeloyl-ACP methyl ester carboxylesterase
MPNACTSDAVIYLPGIMGSELVNANDDVVWGMKPSLLFRQAAFGSVLSALVPRPKDGIRASRPIRWASGLPMLSSVEPYTALETKLKTTVVAPDALLPFAYDWRRSIHDAAQALKPVAREHHRRWSERWKTLSAADRQGLPDPRLTLVCHSMGGLVASYFTAFLDDDQIVRRVVTLGTPFGGSLNAVRALATGEQLPFGLFGSPLRDAVRTMPGVYELVARWNCVEEGSPRRIRPADLHGIGAEQDLAEHALAVMDKLSRAFTGDDVFTGDGRRPPVRCLVGTTQPTLQSVRFVNDTATFAEALGGVDHRGDGTVFRYAAVPPDVEPSYLPQSHGAVAKTDEAVAFVADVLTERPQRDFFQAPRGIGLRVPEAVKPRVPFQVIVLDAEPVVTCQMYNSETNQLVTATQARRQDEHVVATLTAPEPGLYRVAASGGGFNPVERLVAAME